MNDKTYQEFINYVPPKPTKLISMPEIKQAPRKENNMITAKWIVQAVNAIKSGLAAKLEKDGVAVYKCGKIIRIDIKETTEVIE